MTKLKEQLWAVAKEYARQFGEIIGYRVDHWMGDEPWVCCFGDCYFFEMEEMVELVDKIDEHCIRYGSRKAVGQEVIDWMNWVMEGMPSDMTAEYVMKRVTHQLRPNISLSAWMDGRPREDRKAWEGPDAEYLRLQNDVEMMERIISEYRGNRTLENVMTNLQAKLDIEAKKKAERDFQEWEKFLKKGKNDAE